MREKSLNGFKAGDLLFPDESNALMGLLSRSTRNWASTTFATFSRTGRWIIVELKAIHWLTDLEVAQVLNYFKVTGLSLALIPNFSAHDKLEWNRVALSRA